MFALVCFVLRRKAEHTIMKEMNTTVYAKAWIVSIDFKAQAQPILYIVPNSTVILLSESAVSRTYLASI